MPLAVADRILFKMTTALVVLHKSDVGPSIKSENSALLLTCLKCVLNCSNHG